MSSPAFSPTPSAPPDLTPVRLPGRHSPKHLRNRLAAVMEHLDRYSFQGPARLAHDAGISRSALSRLLRGQSAPSYRLVLSLTRALERQLGRPLDPRELIAPEGAFPTPSVCTLMGCRGCLPASAYDAEERLKPGYRNLVPGQWSGLEPTEISTAPTDRKEEDGFASA